MDLAVKIAECQTIAELSTLERLYLLNEVEQRLLFERKLEIFRRITEWRVENEQLGLTADFTDTWTPEQRERFMREWQNDDPLLQMGRGEKRSIDEVNGSATDEVSDNVFTVTNIKQVKVKKFSTTGVDYTVQFTDTFAHLELSQFHDRLHGIFESILNTITRDIPEHDQVRFVLHSPQLETPISLPFMALSHLTTERVLAQIERVIQSNHEFRLNDSVKVNLVHAECPMAVPEQNAVKLIWKSI
jgi:hypothetical protein